jgi:hypothetical protein
MYGMAVEDYRMARKNDQDSESLSFQEHLKTVYSQEYLKSI